MRWGIVPWFAKTEDEFKALSTVNAKSDRLTDARDGVNTSRSAAVSSPPAAFTLTEREKFFRHRQESHQRRVITDTPSSPIVESVTQDTSIPASHQTIHHFSSAADRSRLRRLHLLRRRESVSCAGPVLVGPRQQCEQWTVCAGQPLNEVNRRVQIGCVCQS
jgi:hypothetical protein